MPHNVSNVTITGLDPSTNYSVTVVVGNSVGKLSSPSLEVPGMFHKSLWAMVILSLNVEHRPRQPYSTSSASAMASTSASTSAKMATTSTSIRILESNLLPTGKNAEI